MASILYRPLMWRHVPSLYKTTLRNASSSANTLTWTDYFQHRKNRKLSETTGGVVSGLAGWLGGSYYFFAVAEFDPMTPLFGLPDPTILYIMAAFGVGAVSFASGTLVSGQLWRALKHR
jgi:Mitochondrial import protein Pam17